MILTVVKVVLTVVRLVLTVAKMVLTVVKMVVTVACGRNRSDPCHSYTLCKLVEADHIVSICVHVIEELARRHMAMSQLAA